MYEAAHKVAGARLLLMREKSGKVYGIIRWDLDHRSGRAKSNSGRIEGGESSWFDDQICRVIYTVDLDTRFRWNLI